MGASLCRMCCKLSHGFQWLLLSIKNLDPVECDISWACGVEGELTD